MTAYAGGPQIQNYLDKNRPDYGAVALSGALSTSALERALMKLNSEVAGTEQIFNARINAGMSAADDASRIADAGVFAAGAQALGTAASGFISAIPTGGPSWNKGVPGNDFNKLSDANKKLTMENFGKDMATWF